MWETEDYKDKSEKVLCAVLINYLHTFVFNVFSVFNTLYVHN